LDGRGSSVRRIKDLGLCVKRDRANTFSSKFHLQPLSLCLLFLKIAAKKLVASTLKEDERLSISGSLSTSQSIFNFFPLDFFFRLQSVLSLRRICSYNFLFLSVNSESEAKSSFFSREHLALGSDAELCQLICPSSASEACIFSELRGKEVSFTGKVLTAVGDGWIADISKQVDGLSA
jgi:hypothetical protein